MTTKKCAACNKRSGLLLEMDVRERLKYHGRCYHMPCFLWMQGVIHNANDKNDPCTGDTCNAALFVRARWYDGVILTAISACRILTFLNLAVLMYYGLLARVFLSPVAAGVLYVAAFTLVAWTYRSNRSKLIVFIIACLYAIYVSSGESVVADHLYDVFIIAKLAALLFAIDRGVRTLMLLRIVDDGQMARESGALGFTCYAWPIARYLPIYGSLLTGVGAQIATYVLCDKTLLSLHLFFGVIGAASLVVLLYPPRVVPRWIPRWEELVSLPF